MKKNPLYNPESVIQDVANLVYVIADVREGQYDGHSLHQTFDICAPGNIDRVRTALELATAEVEALIYDVNRVREGRRPPQRGDALRWRLIVRLVHEYLVATVLADWLAVAFPPLLATLAGTASSRSGNRTGSDSVVSQWKERSAEAWDVLKCEVQSMTGATSFSRRVPPL